MFEMTMEQILDHQKAIGTVGESYWYYNDTVQLIFDRKSWKYHRVCDDGSLEPQYGVTGTCHIIDKSEALMPWAVKRAMERLRKIVVEQYAGGDEGTQIKLFAAELDQIIKQAKKAADEEKDAAGEIGHDAHGWLEDYLSALIRDNAERREELLAKLPQDERAASCCVAAIDWMVRHNVRWIETERKIYSRAHKYAGTMDGLAHVDSCDDHLCCPESFKDRLSIIDWKTSNYLYLEYLLQTSAYWFAYVEEFPDRKISDRWIIRLGKEDAEFDPWHAEGQDVYQQDWAGFLAALGLVKALDIIEGRMVQQRRVKRTEIKKIEAAARERAMRERCPKSDDYKGSRRSKCFDDGSQCRVCAAKFSEAHGGIA
jgi:hypothetical protein